MRRAACTLLCLILMSGPAGSADTGLVARWDFDGQDGIPGKAHAGLKGDQPGPRPPEYPSFDPANQAIRLDGRGAYLAVPDPGSDSALDFGDGDAMTLEAWVRLEDSRDSGPMYVIGKGRTGSDEFAADNQNWAMRVTVKEGVARLSFLFATASAVDVTHWHRWDSLAGFDPETSWHHIALSYRFGDPESIRGWIDGQITDGRWQLGGATKVAPVVDNDEVWIGSSQAGNVGNSFRGWIDAVAIHRQLVEPTVIAKRFDRVGGPQIIGRQLEVMPALGSLPDGKVLLTLHESMPSPQRWPFEGQAWPDESERWTSEHFLLPRIPRRYDDWGIRDAWKAPVLLRVAADVPLRSGTHQFLLRARGMSRLWVDGALVARTDAVIKKSPDGEEPITPLAQPPVPGARPHGYHQQEVFGEATLGKVRNERLEEDADELHRVVLELIVGGGGHRTESGEVCVAVRSEDGRSYEILRSADGDRLLLTDADVEPVLDQIENSLAANDDWRRRRAAASRDGFWNQRHQYARAWDRQHPLDLPDAVRQSEKPIDTFLSLKWDQASTENAKYDEETKRRFHDQVLPILRDHCFRCHGEKDNGGLRLDSRDAAVRGGDSEDPAIVPGDPSQSQLIARVRSDDESDRMPPTDTGLDEQQIAVLERWILDGAKWPAPPVSDDELALAPIIGDEAFLRRVYLDAWGVPPTMEVARSFLANTEKDKRKKLIDRLLQDERTADHWMSFWLDLLAENPTLLNQSLNSTGPFRWFLHDALRDRKPLDRMVTELILMRGSQDEGGSAGFAQAGENDAPMAAKGHILASAFLGIELQCARCHDSPYHRTTQRDLFSLAAMLERKAVTVPPTSRVPAAFFDQQQRESLIQVTLEPDQRVAPKWTLAEVTGVEDGDDIDSLTLRSDDSRHRLAALITAPQNQRFSRVLVNRLWKRLVGAGLVEPVHDWEGSVASHNELLDWLARELVTNDYDAHHVCRLIMNSDLYQREAIGANLAKPPTQRFFVAPDRRRLTAEQIVDSLHAATGKKMDVEELTFVHDGRRPIGKRQSLGRPKRAWMFASLNNERDRPSLSLPKARSVTDVLKAFGWDGSRQRPIHVRETEPNVLQPGVLANGTLVATLTRVSVGSRLARMAVEAESPEVLVDRLFLQILTRHPTPDERVAMSDVLAAGFDSRLIPEGEYEFPSPPPELPLVTWFNHLRPDATTIQQELERRVREGPPPDPRLRESWRTRLEDVTWSLINHREFVWVP